MIPLLLGDSTGGDLGPDDLGRKLPTDSADRNGLLPFSFLNRT